MRVGSTDLMKEMTRVALRAVQTAGHWAATRAEEMAESLAELTVIPRVEMTVLKKAGVMVE